MTKRRYGAAVPSIRRKKIVCCVRGAAQIFERVPGPENCQMPVTRLEHGKNKNYEKDVEIWQRAAVTSVKR